MTNESVFFNPGDAISASHDFTQLRRSAQIFKAEKPTSRQLVIAQNDQSGSYAVYYADAAKSTGTAYHIKEKI
ncbi:hypothetical protein FP435_07365 [Lactobacillus sp. PV037]|uniref:hypothetical protein n=1 Tax=unclassified Lactobacillus TaxID=2620435 RepID=UPI00223F3E89|nr:MULTISPECIES: hypothetical protein [unclassified Lactobacillus]QNQ81706.1 hypothetical protein FP433_00885 [Lactobacillus sp. PV012]QNQ84249.1 hypothetical protein FP435_07365 [Lactobacillus sp. PV037]